MSITKSALAAAILCIIPMTGARAQQINKITAAAPKQAVTLEGIVRDPEGRVLAAAEVIVDGNHRAITNSRGEFSIPGLESGLISFTARRIGYTPAITAIQVEPGLTVSLAVKLVPSAVELGTVVVEGKKRDEALWQTGFYQRKESGRGHYFDEAYLEHFNSGLGSLMASVPSVRVQRASNGIALATGKLANGGDCILNVYVDGNLLPWANQAGLDDVVNRDDVLGVEVYPRASEMPAKISGMGGGGALGIKSTMNLSTLQHNLGSSFAECGAILIWTKPLRGKGSN